MRRFGMEPDPNASGRTPFSVACTAGEGRRCSRTAADNARGGREPLVAAMHRCGIDIADSCLRMVGPAAADYILASCPSGA
jgi:hypothetical protein